MLASQRLFSYAIVIAFFSTFFLFPFSSLAQSPESINYQAIARNSSGIVLEGQTGTVTFTIFSGTATAGNEVYQEKHDVTTNSFGLFNVKIGEGYDTLPGKPFSSIDWGNNQHFLNVMIDFFGSEDLGTTELISVPYALYAKSSGNQIKAGEGISVLNNDSIINIGDLSSSNELITEMELINDSILVINEGIEADTVDLSIFRNTIANQSLGLILNGNQVERIHYTNVISKH